MPRQAKRNVERGREGRLPSAEELTQGASAQELLAQCLSSGLLLEKEESKSLLQPVPAAHISSGQGHCNLQLN
ncbi:hypothetical protein CB1_001169011 [Camelus ferus]|nr:hypothetical protein CB1_001169011 [Camelus ferus]